MKKYLYFLSVFLLFSLIVFNLMFNILLHNFLAAGESFKPPILGEYTKNNKEIKEEISYWKDIVSSHPDYRDGYMKLAILNYKVDNLDEAKTYLQRVLDIDPNFKPALEMEEVLGK